MSDNVSSMAGFYKPPTAEYQLEEKMNDNLMKQFQPMLFSDDRNNRPSRAEGNPLLNSVSDFS